MKYKFGVIIFFVELKFLFVRSGRAPYILGGNIAHYDEYPHAVYLKIKCTDQCICGGSILNQRIVLTAAHCLEDCSGSESDTVDVRYGHENPKKMNRIKMKDYVIHEKYDQKLVLNDIALLLTYKKIQLSAIVKRVIVMKRPPVHNEGYLAGWGMDENQKTGSFKHTAAFIQSLENCYKKYKLPTGTFCSGPVTGVGEAAAGDSGSALLIHKYVQIGIVSFKHRTSSIVIYTNVSYHFDWIRDKANTLYCGKSAGDTLF